MFSFKLSYYDRTKYTDTVRTIVDERRNSEFLRIQHLRKDDQAIEDAEKSFYGENLFNLERLGNIYFTACQYKCKFEKIENLQDEKAIEKDLIYGSNYIAHRLCKLMEKALCIVEDQDLNDILSKIDEKCRGNNNKYEYDTVTIIIADIERNIKHLSAYIDKVKGFSMRNFNNGFSVFSDLILAVGSIKIVGYCSLKSNEFEIIKNCISCSEGMAKTLSNLAISIASICKIKELQEDDSIFPKFYLMYRELECFLHESNKVDLSSYEKKIAEKKGLGEENVDVKDILVKEFLLRDLINEIENLSIYAKIVNGVQDNLRHILTNQMERLNEKLNKVDEKPEKASAESERACIFDILSSNLKYSEEIRSVLQKFIEDVDALELNIECKDTLLKALIEVINDLSIRAKHVNKIPDNKVLGMEMNKLHEKLEKVCDKSEVADIFDTLSRNLEYSTAIQGSLPQFMVNVNAFKQRLENMCEKRNSTDVDNPKSNNTIEGQELQVEAQAMERTD